MAAQLTDRQKQIKRLLDQGKSPAEAGRALGISENAVYQARTRIKKASGARSTTARKSTTRRTGTRKSSRRSAQRAPQPITGEHSALGSAKPLTPLQAVRARRDEIKAQLKVAEQAAEAAHKTAEQADTVLASAQSKVSDELAQLNAAELALTGAMLPKPRRSGGSRNGSSTKARTKTATQSAPAPAEEPPAPAEEPPAPAPQADPAPSPAVSGAEAEAIQQTVPVEEERPGVPVDPDFDAGPVEAPREREVELARAGADEHASPGEFEQVEDAFGE